MTLKDKIRRVGIVGTISLASLVGTIGLSVSGCDKPARDPDRQYISYVCNYAGNNYDSRKAEQIKRDYQEISRMDRKEFRELVKLYNQNEEEIFKFLKDSGVDISTEFKWIDFENLKDEDKIFITKFTKDIGEFVKEYFQIPNSKNGVRPGTACGQDRCPK